MNTVVRVLPPGRLASARSYIAREADCGSGYIEFTSGSNAAKEMTEAIFADCVLLNNPLQNWRDIPTKLRWIFAHRKMTKFLHDDNFGTLDALCSTQSIGWSAG